MSDPTTLEAVRGLLPPGWRRSTREAVDRLYSLRSGGEEGRRGLRRFNILYGGVKILARSLRPEEVYGVLEADLRLYVAERAARRVFVHAGVVGLDGEAILIPGRSFTGKTTLVAELVRAGATYYSDEYAVLDAGGLVHPYARPLSVRKGEGAAARTRLRVEELGGRAGSEPLPVRLVVVTGYERGARWNPRRISPGEGVLGMLANTVSARRHPERVLSILSEVAGRAVILAGARGEAIRAAASILRKATAASRPLNVTSDRVSAEKGRTRHE